MNSRVISESAVEEKGYFIRSREVFIRLCLIAAMVISCVLLLRPFLNLITCAIIISVGIYPAHQILTKALGGRAKLSAALCSIILLLVLIVPSVLLGGTLADGIHTIGRQLQAGRIDLPPPPSSLDKLPIVGRRLEELWTLCSTNLSELATRFAPQIKESIPAVISASAGIGGTIVLLLAAIVLAGYFLATSEANGRFATRLFVRIFSESGVEFRDLVFSTIRTVATGILGVAVIQTIFASLGFWIVGLPGAGLWALIFLIASVLQVGVIGLLPAVLYGFAAFSTTRAVIFLVWCIVVGLMDNVLKPILLGRGAKVPMPVIFLGVLGGFMFMNSIIGLFVGAIILSVGYKLFMAWLDSGMPAADPVNERVPVPKPVP